MSVLKEPLSESKVLSFEISIRGITTILHAQTPMENHSTPRNQHRTSIANRITSKPHSSIRIAIKPMNSCSAHNRSTATSTNTMNRNRANNYSSFRAINCSSIHSTTTSNNTIQTTKNTANTQHQITLNVPSKWAYCSTTRHLTTPHPTTTTLHHHPKCC